MPVVVARVEGPGDIEPVAGYSDGEWLEGEAGFIETYSDLEGESELSILNRFDGPVLVSFRAEEDGEGLDLSAGVSGFDMGGVPEWDQHYLAMLTNSVWADGTDRALIAESEVPEMVTERIREAINSGALFSSFDSIPSDKLADLRVEFSDMLDHDGWTTDDLVDQLQEFEPSLSDSQAETVARTESQAIVNTARKEAYEDRGLADDAVFRWVSQADNRRTDACEWLSNQTEDGVSLERLKELIGEAPEHDEDMQDNLARPDDFLPHINCRSTWTRVVE